MRYVSIACQTADKSGMIFSKDTIRSVLILKSSDGYVFMKIQFYYFFLFLKINCKTLLICNNIIKKI